MEIKIGFLSDTSLQLTRLVARGNGLLPKLPNFIGLTADRPEKSNLRPLEVFMVKCFVTS